MAIEKPPEFTLDNIHGTFGHYIQDPRGNILRGLAELFCTLDPAYKSHDKVKIGVKSLPKRIMVVRPLPVYVEDPDKPPMNKAHQQQVQFLIEGAAVPAESHCYVHRITPTDVETRRSVVNGILKERMANIQTKSQSVRRH